MTRDSNTADPRVARTRDAVVAAVRELVQAAGIEAVTHQRVAEVAGVGRASVYRHWPDRTQLLLDALADLPVGTDEPSSSGDLAADLRRELGRLQRILNDSPFVPQVAALVSRTEWDPELRVLKQRLLERGTAQLRHAIAHGIERGQLDAELDPTDAVAILAGPLFYKRLLVNQHISDDFVTDLVERLLGRADPSGRRSPPGVAQRVRSET
jgi:AcrR family transcriptional regulator